MAHPCRPLVLRHGCAFEATLLTLESAGIIAAGTLLARDSATSKFVLFEKGSLVGGRGVVKAVLSHKVEGEAGDNAVRVILGGVVAQERLSIAAGADRSIDWTVLDALRRCAITATLND